MTKEVKLLLTILLMHINYNDKYQLSENTVLNLVRTLLY